MPNRLAQESSPYLLQHAANPVDWSPWDAAALERSKVENRPIFLSIGYSACHWCHVMEHESFENPLIARILNEHFICIKVDREERPDLDQIYMNAVQIMTGHGGWPMSVFLTPDLKPFYGGTYWPPTARSGMPGFDQVLHAVADAWLNRRGQAIEQADQLTEHLQQLATANVGSGVPTPRLIMLAAAALEKNFDPLEGGFGNAPKFPHPMDLRLLLRVWRRTGRENLLHVVSFTLDKMAAGGMYDQLGGGFHRYSTDARWLVPHFEKMLYDNALLTPTYLEAFQATGNAEFARVARETCDYVLREMTDAAGGFYSTQDADSEGVEGKFFVWTPDEIAAAIGDAAAATFCRVYDITPGGNFEERNIVNLPKTIDQCANDLGRDPAELRAELADSRAKLLAARDQRIHPGLDDKVLAAWNGLMIDALAQAACVLDEPRYLAAAVKAADFVTTKMRRDDGRLLHCWRGGVAKLDAYLDDYACLINALVTVYEATFDERWIAEAVRLADLMLELFADREQGGFFYTASDHEQLIARQKDLFDNATPSGNSIAALGLLRLAKLTGRADLLAAVEATFLAAANLMLQSPTAAGQMLIAYDMFLGPSPEIVVFGDPSNVETATALADLRRRFLPNKVVALRAGAPTSADTSPLAAVFAGKTAHAVEPTVFICEHFACQAPVSGTAAALAAWEKLAAERTGI